jgi:hypothetical protein
VVLNKKIPVVCFGIRKAPGEKEKYLYILLFKNAPEEKVGDRIEGRGKETNTGGDVFVRFTRSGKAIEITYQYKVDEKTQALKSEMLKVGTTEIKEDSPRVFLVDLIQEKVVYRPVKVDLPTDIPTLHERVPELNGPEGKAWAATMLRVVEQIKKKSPEVRKFLEP